MPRDGNGNYGLPAGNPVVTATTISSTVQNNTENDLAAAITASLAADGQTSPSADLKMSGFKHKNVANASSRISTNSSYASAADVQDGTITHLTGVAGTNTITASAPLGLAAYVTGQIFTFLPAVTNTGATTLNVNSIGAKSVFSNGQACGGNELIVNQPVEVKYDGTQFNILAGPPVFVDTYFRIKSAGDASKQIKVSASNIPTGTTVTVTTGAGTILPAGLVFPYAGSSIPTGWLACDGSSQLRATYPALFTAIGTTWGSVDGTHFTLPDFMGRTLIGDGAGSGLTVRTLAGSGGEETHQLSVAELAAHTHGQQGRGNVSGATTPQGTSGGGGIVTFDPLTTSTGSDTAHNNMQPYKVVKYIISY